MGLPPEETKPAPALEKPAELRRDSRGVPYRVIKHLNRRGQLAEQLVRVGPRPVDVKREQRRERRIK
jgi:hypothetical protein